MRCRASPPALRLRCPVDPSPPRSGGSDRPRPCSRGNSCALPESVIPLRPRCSSADPPGEELVHLHERLDRGRHSTCVWLGTVTLVAPTISGPGCRGRPRARASARPRRRAGRAAVDVHVVAYARRPRRIGQVRVHDGRPERVAEDVDLGLAGALLDLGDQLVEPRLDRVEVGQRGRRVVLEHVDVAARVAVAAEAQRPGTRTAPRSPRRRARRSAVSACPSPPRRARRRGAPRARRSATWSSPDYLPPTFFRNGIRFATKSFFGLAELGSLCE